jgi:hypothetical protein
LLHAVTFDGIEADGHGPAGFGHHDLFESQNAAMELIRYADNHLALLFHFTIHQRRDLVSCRRSPGVHRRIKVDPDMGFRWQ